MKFRKACYFIHNRLYIFFYCNYGYLNGNFVINEITCLAKSLVPRNYKWWLILYLLLSVSVILAEWSPVMHQLHLHPVKNEKFGPHPNQSKSIESETTGKAQQSMF